MQCGDYCQWGLGYCLQCQVVGVYGVDFVEDVFFLVLM